MAKKAEFGERTVDAEANVGKIAKKAAFRKERVKKQPKKVAKKSYPHAEAAVGEFDRNALKSKMMEKKGNFDRDAFMAKKENFDRDAFEDKVMEKKENFDRDAFKAKMMGKKETF